MEFVQDLVNNSDFPVFTAFMLGLIVALHPCPLAANIAAMGYLARDVHEHKRVFVNGLVYTVGRILAYSVLGVVLTAVFRNSIDMEAAGRWFGEWGERLLAPLLIIVGLYFILDRFLHRHEHCPNVEGHSRRLHGLWGCLLLGVILALSFCPESAIVYFGMLMPLSAHSNGGYLLPVVFSIGTAIPTVVMAWAVAYGISGTSAIKNKMHLAQHWINTIVGLLFIGAGTYCLFN